MSSFPQLIALHSKKMRTTATFKFLLRKSIRLRNTPTQRSIGISSFGTGDAGSLGSGSIKSGLVRNGRVLPLHGSRFSVRVESVSRLRGELG